METVGTDWEDMVEFREQLGVGDGEEYYDVKRLIIQERGEDEYYYLHKIKAGKIKELLEDEFTRRELSANLEYYNKQQGREQF